MPHEDLGAPAFRKVDMEACMPGRALSLARAAAAEAAVAAEALASGAKAAAGKKGATANKAAAAAAAAAAAEAENKKWGTMEGVRASGVAEHYGEISSASNCTDYQVRRLM